MTVAVTPTLFVGDAEMQFSTTFCDGPTAAYAVIKHGLSARVPTFEIAEMTLRLLGLDEQTIDERIRYAKTEEVLHAV